MKLSPNQIGCETLTKNHANPSFKKFVNDKNNNIKDGYVAISTSSNQLRCGYYALAIGILGLKADVRAAVLDKIGWSNDTELNSPFTQQQLMALQISVGNVLYDYSENNRETIETPLLRKRRNQSNH